MLFIILLIFILILILIFLYLKKNKDKFENEKIVPIPKVIHKIYLQQNGEMDNFPLKPLELNNAHESWKIMNPDYNIKYYSLNDCRKYLKNNFNDTDFLQTFDCIQAFANKTSFIRICILYNEGGWYSDWKQSCLINNLLDKLNKNKKTNIILSWDRGNNIGKKNKHIQNCFIGSNKNNLFLKEAINEIINNVKYKYYGYMATCTTGPGVLGVIYNNYKFPINLTFKNNGYIYYNKKKIILHKCKNCGKGQNWKNGNNYGVLWSHKKLYNDFILKNKIPKIIHKTGPYDKDNLPFEINNLFNKLKKENKDYNLIYYNNDDCYNLIKKNFNEDVLWAYNKLIPIAYKSDLFRYCVLYLYGGIYSDIQHELLLPLDNIIDFDKDTLVLSKDKVIQPHTEYGIQISFIACIPKLNIFMNCINQIIENCKKNYYGKTQLDVTGPYLFKSILNKENINYVIKLKETVNKTIIKYHNTFNKTNDNKLIKTKIDNFNMYTSNNKYYSILYNNKNIYNN